jgi:hypothetical protein
MKQRYDIVISINVHHRPMFLLEQLSNINKYVKLNNLVILNCNHKMGIELQRFDLGPNVVVNPEYIDKKRYHGSITRGIVSNMKFALQNYMFDYFVIMSLRCRLYREINNSFYVDVKSEVNKNKHYNYDLRSWHWPKFVNSLLYQECVRRNWSFDYKSCEFLLSFLESNIHIMTDIFNFNWCVEEFALQSICSNFSDFFDLGNGCYTMPLHKCSSTRFIHKIDDK